MNLSWGIDGSKISNRNCPSSWVAVHFRVGTYLTDGRNLQASLFLQLTDSTLFCSLIHVHKTARERPSSLERVEASFYEQNMRRGFFCYHYAVSGNSWSWIFVSVFHLIKVKGNNLIILRI